MDDQDFVNEVIKSVLARGDEYGIAELNEIEKVVYLLCVFEAETATNSLYGFYHNSSGNWAIETESALKTIGADDSFELLREANQMFASGEPAKDREIRWTQMDAFSEDEILKLCKIGHIILDYPDKWTEKLENFILANREKFAK